MSLRTLRELTQLNGVRALANKADVGKSVHSQSSQKRHTARLHVLVLCLYKFGIDTSSLIMKFDSIL